MNIRSKQLPVDDGVCPYPSIGGDTGGLQNPDRLTSGQYASDIVCRHQFEAKRLLTQSPNNRSDNACSPVRNIFGIERFRVRFFLLYLKLVKSTYAWYVERGDTL